MDREFELPKSVNIGGYDYEITGYEGKMGSQSAGRINYRRRIIEVDSDQNPQNIREALLHETIHGCSDIVFGEDLHLTESQTRGVCAMMFAMIENPANRSFWNVVMNGNATPQANTRNPDVEINHTED